MSNRHDQRSSKRSMGVTGSFGAGFWHAVAWVRAASAPSKNGPKRGKGGQERAVGDRERAAGGSARGGHLLPVWKEVDFEWHARKFGRLLAEPQAGGGFPRCGCGQLLSTSCCELRSATILTLNLTVTTIGSSAASANVEAQPVAPRSGGTAVGGVDG